MLTHTGTQTIKTQNLTLRRFAYSDDDLMLKNWIADENVQHLYLEPVYTTKKEVNELLDLYISSYEKDDYYRWAIIEDQSGECIGQVAFFLVDSKNHFVEVEYCIGTAFQGKGYATEATKAVIKYGFEEINLNKVQICHKPSNLSSKKVIEKCGFKYDGKLRDYFYFNGEYTDRLFYSILKREFSAS